MTPQRISVIILSIVTLLLSITSVVFYYKFNKPGTNALKQYPEILAPGIASILTFVGLLVCVFICINNAGGCTYCGNCVTGPASPSPSSPVSPVPPSGPSPAPVPPPSPPSPVDTGPFSTAEMYSSKIGSVTSLLGGTNIYAANGGQRTILTNGGKTYVYPLSADGFGNGVTTGRYMSFSLFLAGVPDDIAGVVSAVYMVPIPPVSATGSTMKYAEITGAAYAARPSAVLNLNDNDKYGVAMGALYNDGQGIGYVTEDGYYANSGRTEIDLMETSNHSCQTTHHGFYGTHYNGKTTKEDDEFLPSRLGNTKAEARGDGKFPNYIVQDNMPSTSTATSLGNASTGVGYTFTAVDGTIDPNGIWNNPYTISAVNGIDYFNSNWGYGIGKYIDTTSQKGVQYDYYIKPILVTDSSITPTSSNLNDYWSDVNDTDTQTWYTLQIYYRIVQEQSDGSVNVLPNQAYYDALAAVDNSQVTSFIVNSEEAGDGLWFLVDSNPSQAFSDAYGLPRAPSFYSGYDLKYMILTQSYWTPSLIGEAGAGPTIWLDGNEDTSSNTNCSATSSGQSQCTTGHDVDCTVCRGPNVASASQVDGSTLDDRCTSAQQSSTSDYYTSQQVQNVVACQGAPGDPEIGNMTVFAEDGVTLDDSSSTRNCCGSIGLDDDLSGQQASNASNDTSYYNIFYNLYMDVYLDDPRWTLDYQYRGVNTVKTAPAKYEALMANTENWRGAYGPQFGICNIESGWPGSRPDEGGIRGVSIVNLIDEEDKKKPDADLCTPFLSKIDSTCQLARDQPKTLQAVTDMYGTSHTYLDGGEMVTEKMPWYQNICMPTDTNPSEDPNPGTPGDGILYVDLNTNAQYAMRVDCNFLKTALQTSLP